jgi:hypothetical protein
MPQHSGSATETTTMLVQMEEEKRAVRALPFVTKLSFVRTCSERQGSRGSGFPDSCAKKQGPPFHLSGERTTLLACLQELRKRMEEDRGDCAELLLRLPEGCG